MAKRYFLEIAYNGTSYHGWQVQPNADSIHQCLNLLGLIDKVLILSHDGFGSSRLRSTC